MPPTPDVTRPLDSHELQWDALAGTAPTGNTDGITRGLEALGPNGDVLRVYRRGDVALPSVTSILRYLEEDDSGLKYWKARNNGKGNSADARHVLWYTRHRGTLAHYAVLNPLTLKELWGRGEEFATRELTELTEPEVRRSNFNDVVYSVEKYTGRVTTRLAFAKKYMDIGGVPEDILAQHCREDVAEFAGKFDVIARVAGITQKSVQAAELFLFSEDYGFAGQTDLVYRDPTGNLVMADLKTSGGLRNKFKYQAAAYAAAYEAETGEKIDRLEVIRIKPNKTRDWDIHTTGEWARHTPFHTSAGWPERREDLWAEFRELADKVNAASSMPADVDTLSDGGEVAE